MIFPPAHVEDALREEIAFDGRLGGHRGPGDGRMGEEQVRNDMLRGMACVQFQQGKSRRERTEYRVSRSVERAI